MFQPLVISIISLLLMSFQDSHGSTFLNLSMKPYPRLFILKTQVENQLNTKIKIFQSDWGSEFRSLDFLFTQHGIIHRLSCPYTSDQNGIVERKHRHIVDTGLTLLAQSSISLHY